MDWTGTRVLVTGAGGFIGSHLCERLVELGAEVCAFTSYRSDSGAGWLDRSPRRDQIQIVRGDVVDPDRVREAIRGVDTTFHLAALIGIPYSYSAPESYLRVNAGGTLNVLQAAKAEGIRRLVHTSTSEVYGNAQRLPIDETHPLVAQSPYAASKIAGDKLAESFQRAFGLPVITVRPFNTFGPRQSARAVIPSVITQCLAGDKLELGSLEPRRDFNYVSNTVDGFLAAASADDAALGGTYNLGTGRDVSIGELVKTIAELMGIETTITQDPNRVRPAASEVDRLLAAVGLAKSALGWEPKVGLEQGLQHTIDWLTANREAYRPGEYAR